MDKYMGAYCGYEDMRIGVVQVGNGEHMDDGMVSDSLLIQNLTKDTAMVQALAMAEMLFLLGVRERAISAVLTLTDGKPSFLFNAFMQRAKEAKDWTLFCTNEAFNAEAVKGLIDRARVRNLLFSARG